MASEEAWYEAQASFLPGLSAEKLRAMSQKPTFFGLLRVLFALWTKRRDPMRLDLDKSWHVFSYLLTGEHAIAEGHREGAPLHNVIFGGRATAIMTGYGPVRYLSGQDLQEVAAALAGLSEKKFLVRWDPAAMKEKDIYAEPEEAERKHVARFFARLRRLFADAAKRGEVVAIYAH